MGYIANKEWKSGRRYYAVYKKPNGKWKWEVAGRLKKNAESLLRRRETEIAEGNYNERPTEILFNEYYEQWANSKRKSLKPSTQVSIECSFRLHILPFFGKTYLSDIKPIVIQEWVNTLSGKNLALATVGRCYRYLRACLRQAYAWGILAANPCRSIILPRTNHEELDFLEPSEIAVLMREANEPQRTLYAVLAFSGLRLGEALGLGWKHINFKDNIIQVERAWSYWGGLQEPKTTSSRRAVPIMPTLGKMLRDHYEREGHPESEALLFSYDGEKPLDPSNLRRDFTATVERAGLKRVTLHSLRHSFASAMLASGASIKALQRCLGHASATMTLNTYSHLIQENIGESLLLADTFLTGGGVESRYPDPKSSKISSIQENPSR